MTKPSRCIDMLLRSIWQQGSSEEAIRSNYILRAWQEDALMVERLTNFGLLGRLADYIWPQTIDQFKMREIEERATLEAEGRK